MKWTWILVLVALLPLSLAAAERPLIPSKSEIGFTVKQMGVGVSGNFREFTARIDLDPQKPEAGKAQIEVTTASIATGEPQADTEAVAKPWLNAAGFPKARFASDEIHTLGQGRFEVKGKLTIKGKTREVKVPVTLENQPDGTALVAGEFTLLRTDFGVGGGEWNDDELVANEVPVRFRFTLGPASAAAPAAPVSKSKPKS